MTYINGQLSAMLNDSTIDKIQSATKFITPYCATQGYHEASGTSYGITSHGYDVRLGGEFRDRSTLYKSNQHVLYPNDFILATTIEYIKMPKFLKGALKGKSTLLRKGIAFIGEAPIEAGWEGNITLEITNHGSQPVTLYEGMGIGQLEFFYVTPAQFSYGEGGRSGKYQKQIGVTEAK